MLAAALFGLSTPLVQKLGQGFGPFTTAALLCADAVLALRLYRETMDRRVWAEALMVLAGGLEAPTCLQPPGKPRTIGPIPLEGNRSSSRVKRRVVAGPWRGGGMQYFFMPRPTVRQPETKKIGERP